uniref:Uncharacterized protein n=1 Tax=Aegilops tauschii subsp. strangulata TaxID=200361 RepID=A0A453MY68_AEGTS
MRLISPQVSRIVFWLLRWRNGLCEEINPLCSTHRSSGKLNCTSSLFYFQTPPPPLLLSNF